MPSKPANPRGRPPLAEGERSIQVSVRIPASTYDAACAQARRQQVSLAQLTRRALASYQDDDDDDQG